MSPVGGGPRWFPGDAGHHHVPPSSPHYIADWHRGCCEPMANHHDHGAVLRAAADKLDRQAEAHGEAIHDYTDLLRVWADNASRWAAGR